MDESVTKAEIDLKAISHNVSELRGLTSRKAKLMAVVKANAYGHGIVEISKQALNSGADALGVARLNEALQLREAGLSSPILILGYSTPGMAGKLIENELTQTIYSLHTAKEISEQALEKGETIKIHLKIDTGMGRLGMVPNGLLLKNSPNPKDAIEEIEAIKRLAGLETEGIFTHFATADSKNKSYAIGQMEVFLEFIGRLQKRGIEIPIKHAANSAAIIDMPETHLDMVRAGISIYGLYPSDEIKKESILLKPAMELKSKIVQVKKVPAGFKVSYGSTYETQKPTTIATVPIGYGDGYSRALSSCGHMLVRGSRAPVVGRVCMDLTMLDVGHIPGVEPEDEVVIFGRQGGASITVDEIASILNTINYEIVTTLSGRIQRVYHK